MGQNEIRTEDVTQGKKKKRETSTSNEENDTKKKIEIHIVCCTIM